MCVYVIDMIYKYRYIYIYISYSLINLIDDRNIQYGVHHITVTSLIVCSLSPMCHLSKSWIPRVGQFSSPAEFSNVPSLGRTFSWRPHDHDWPSERTWKKVMSPIESNGQSFPVFHMVPVSQCFFSSRLCTMFKKDTIIQSCVRHRVKVAMSFPSLLVFKCCFFKRPTVRSFLRHQKEAEITSPSVSLSLLWCFVEGYYFYICLLHLAIW